MRSTISTLLLQESRSGSNSWSRTYSVKGEKSVKEDSIVNKNIGGDSNLSNLFRLSNRDCCDLRSNNNTLMLPKPNTNAMKRTFGYRGAMLWNLNHENNYL